MAQFVESERRMSTRLSLRDLGLQPGQAKHEDLTVALEPYRQGGFDYRVEGEGVDARVDISEMQSGRSFRLRMQPQLHGPCSRCLEDASLALDIDSYEVHDPAAGDPELVSDFVEEDELDVSAWAQDALGLEFPHRVLCSDHCKGLCAHCGTNLNETNCDCAGPTTDSRWDKLRELKFDE